MRAGCIQSARVVCSLRKGGSTSGGAERLAGGLASSAAKIEVVDEAQRLGGSEERRHDAAGRRQGMHAGGAGEVAAWQRL